MLFQAKIGFGGAVVLTNDITLACSFIGAWLGQTTGWLPAETIWKCKSREMLSFDHKSFVLRLKQINRVWKRINLKTIWLI